MLPTMEGALCLALGEKRAYEVCAARVYRYWNWLQTETGFTGYALEGLAPMLGVRESWRLRGRYVLRQQDLLAGFAAQTGAARCIAYADHPMDTHGRTNLKGVRCAELERPYGIPYDCLLPAETENLLVACRGASFSHIAASSARLSRTMLALGEAAGEAAVLALRDGCMPDRVEVSELRARLGLERYTQELQRRFGA